MLISRSVALVRGLHALQNPDHQYVGGQLRHRYGHGCAALGAAQLAARLQNLLQAAAAEGVLTRQDLACPVQQLQAHGALQELFDLPLVHC